MRTTINTNYCKGCNICVTMCPVNVYDEGNTTSPRGYIIPISARPEKCMDYEREPNEKKKCELCIYVCPDQAITWGNENE
jgi:2-oxoglutarate ferredoxin oxidoreductase subunit delta